MGDFNRHSISRVDRLKSHRFDCDRHRNRTGQKITPRPVSTQGGRVAGHCPSARVGSIEVEEEPVLHFVDGNRAVAVQRHEVVVVRPRCQRNHLAATVRDVTSWATKP